MVGPNIDPQGCNTAFDLQDTLSGGGPSAFGGVAGGLLKASPDPGTVTRFFPGGAVLLELSCHPNTLNEVLSCTLLKVTYSIELR